jgi:hypothetical protein
VFLESSKKGVHCLHDRYLLNPRLQMVSQFATASPSSSSLQCKILLVVSVIILNL